MTNLSSGADWEALERFGIVWEALGVSGGALERLRESLGDLEKGRPARRPLARLYKLTYLLPIICFSSPILIII